jgi:lysophospholipase L1-like esterase
MSNNPIDDFYQIKQDMDKKTKSLKEPFSKNINRFNLLDSDFQGLKKDFFSYLKSKLNALMHDYRLKRYKDIKFESKRTRLVAEGDSWFSHPFLDDIVEQLYELDYAVCCFSAAGDKLQEMALKAEFRSALLSEHPEAFLFSAGGNDILAPAVLEFLINEKDPDLVNVEKLNLELASLEKSIEQVLTIVWEHKKNLKIFMHGYDYPIPRDCGTFTWIYPVMMSKGIKSNADQQKIIHIIIDTFNQLLAKLAQKYPGLFFHIDVRGTLPDAADWYDEIHPNDQGYIKVTQVIEQELRNKLDIK